MGGDTAEGLLGDAAALPGPPETPLFPANRSPPLQAASNTVQTTIEMVALGAMKCGVQPEKVAIAMVSRMLLLCQGG